jgi:hypothetical protein
LISILRILVLIVFLSTFTSCKYLENKNKPKQEDIVARAYNNYLYKSDLPEFPSGVDSAKLMSAFVDKWLKEQVLVDYAKNNISKLREQKINNEVIKFKNELMVYEYESQLVDLKFDYKTKEEDLYNYYEEYLENFVLPQSIVKLIYIKAEKKINLKENILKEWMKIPEENYKLNVVCNEYLMECHLDTSVWVPRKYIYDRLREVNISESNLKGKATFVKASSATHNVYLYLLDSIEEGQNAPFQYIRKEIEKLLLKKMKSNFVEETKKAMFEKAIKDHEVEIF